MKTDLEGAAVGVVLIVGILGIITANSHFLYQWIFR